MRTGLFPQISRGIAGLFPFPISYYFFKRLRLLPAVFRGLMMIAALVVTSAIFGQATVMTDKSDYQPGDTLVITGSGWLPGEIVRLNITETPTLCPNGHNLYDTADANGDIYNKQFVFNDYHFGLTFLLTATGLTSGYTAQATFTDAHAPGNVTPSSGATAGTNIVSINGSGFSAGSGPNPVTYTVKFGSSSPVSATRSGNSLLTSIIVPTGVVGTVDVEVIATPLSGSPHSSILENGYTYICQYPANVIFTESMGSVGGTLSISDHETAGGFSNIGFTMSGTGDVRNTESSSGKYLDASGGANVFLAKNSSPDKNFQISGINTLGHLSLQLSFGVFKDQEESNGSELTVEVSSDGINYTALSFDPLPDVDGSAVWHYRIASGVIPATANLRIRFTNTAGNGGTEPNIRIDDVRLIAAPIITTQPVNATACEGADATFSVIASGTGLTYQWELSTNSGTTWNPIGGATTSTFNVNDVTNSMNG
ncbi:MAG TPA: hypothetical protein VFX58_00520, partial [Chitinophagaceae bacterium]|nr:hypothetical protein [Chitinophagaceae bacterium]